MLIDSYGLRVSFSGQLVVGLLDKPSQSNGNVLSDLRGLNSGASGLLSKTQLVSPVMVTKQGPQAIQDCLNEKTLNS